MSHLLEYIDINEFKCFKNFHAEGFKRVNLIGGKNNVGKTAFMEACYINIYSRDIETTTHAITRVTYRRKNLEFLGKPYGTSYAKIFLEKVNGISISSKLNSLKFHIKKHEGVEEYIFNIGNNAKKIIVNVNEFSFREEYLENIEFIDNFGLTNSELKDSYESIQKKEKEELVNKYINEFDNNILNFKILGGNNPACKALNIDDYQDINEFGDGLKHYLSIICLLYACENGYLFIDEIDKGIHYTQLDRLWEIILTISKDQNVQVLATTHSRECIESYARVSKKLEDEDISFIELGRDKENKIQANVLDFYKFNKEIANGNGVRGW